MKKCWIGIDVGTHGIRGMGLTDTLDTIAYANEDIATYFHELGRAVQKPEDLRVALNNVMGQLVWRIHDQGYEVEGIGFDGTASLMFMTKLLEPRSDVLMWMDLRASKEAQKISRLTGHLESAELPWAKALWMVEHLTDRLEEMILVEADEWLCSLLTGQIFRGQTNAILKWHGQGEMALPLWADELPQVVARLPRKLCSFGNPVGFLQSQWCKAWGLNHSVPVMAPIIDAYAAALGIGAVQPRVMALILGTSACELFHGTFLGGVAGLWGPFQDPYQADVDVLEAGQPSVGSVVDWLKGLVADNDSMEEFDFRTQLIPPGSAGLKMSPAFQGIRSPWPDADAQGTIKGLRLEHTGAHLLRACYEGTACDIKRALDVIPPKERSTQVIVTGGGSQSNIWMQIIADVCNLPIDVADSGATCRGAAMIAMRAQGICPVNIPILSHIQPGQNQEFYRPFYEDYCEMFPLINA